MRHSEQIKPEAAVQLQQDGLSRKTSYGERLLPAEGPKADRHPL